MGRLGFVIVGGLLLVGTSAFAQSSGPSVSVTGTSANTTIYPGSGGFECTRAPCTSPQSVGDGAGADAFPSASHPFNATNGSAQWNSFVQDDSASHGTITFESSNTLGGQPIGAVSTSTVQLAVTNGSGLNLHSTITPAAMGFYVANVGDGSCILTGTCAQVAPGSSYDFADFAAADGDLQAFAGFSFSVVAHASEFDDHTIFSVA